MTGAARAEPTRRSTFTIVVRAIARSTDSEDARKVGAGGGNGEKCEAAKEELKSDVLLETSTTLR